MDEITHVESALLLRNGQWYDIPEQYVSSFIALAESYGLTKNPPETLVQEGAGRDSN